jgi:hypothetical protein
MTAFFSRSDGGSTTLVEHRYTAARTHDHLRKHHTGTTQTTSSQLVHEPLPLVTGTARLPLPHEHHSPSPVN